MLSGFSPDSDLMWNYLLHTTNMAYKTVIHFSTFSLT